jgi:RNA polymerase primary sigma factor
MRYKLLNDLNDFKHWSKAMTTALVDSISRSDSATSHPDDDALHRRTLELLQGEIEFIPNPSFHESEESEDEIVKATLQVGNEPTRAPADLPAHLRGMCESDLLTHEQEAALFREMNFLKYRANFLRGRLDPDHLDQQLLSAIDSLLAKAETIRDHIIKANMRLVMSIVKKFVTPQQSFDELLSDGIFTLMQAVEKFDYDRGFRFSTYAYRSIARNAYRTLTTARKEEARFTRDAEDWAFEQEEDRSSSAMHDQVWSNLRELTASMLDRLDRRERLIIRSRYALGSHRKVRTFQSLADKLGVSKERVRQLEQRAVAKLRSMAAEYQVDDLFGAAMV